MYCGDNSGWACNELGTQYAEGTLADVDAERAVGYFSRACELRFQAGCLNLLATGSYTQASPRPLDLRLLLREGGRNLIEMPEPELYARACEHAWTFACARTSQ
jgi:TPR repeat protein